MRVDHNAERDIDERIERVIAQVIPNLEEREKVKRSIRNGYLEVRWDEQDGAQFIPTPKLLASIAERNNRGLGEH